MIAAYQRISRADGDLGKDGKDKSNSIENQKELILRYISCKESLQNVPVMDFVDDGYTGSNFDRPGFQQMMDGVRNGKIDTIIVKDLSRFGRDYIGVGEYMEQIFPLLRIRWRRCSTSLQSPIRTTWREMAFTGMSTRSSLRKMK